MLLANLLLVLYVSKLTCCVLDVRRLLAKPCHECFDGLRLRGYQWLAVHALEEGQPLWAWKLKLH